MKSPYHRGAGLAVAGLMLLAGCAEGGKRRSLSGSVQFQGAPLENGIVTLFSMETPPRPVCGALIRNGTFTIPAEQGLEPGQYRVQIRSPRPPQPKGASAPILNSPFNEERIPARYNTQSKLTVDVRAEEKNHFEFTIDE